MSEENLRLPSLSLSSDNDERDKRESMTAKEEEEEFQRPPMIMAMDEPESDKETSSEGFPISLLHHEESHPLPSSTAATTSLDESKEEDGTKSLPTLSNDDVKEEKPNNNDADGKQEITRVADHLRQSSLDEKVFAKTLKDHHLPSSTSSSAANPPQHLKKAVTNHQGLIDTAAPFESVKEAVSKFGGIVDWKAHRVQTVERRKVIETELEKVQNEIPIYKKQAETAEEAKTHISKELETTRRLIEELKINLEKSQTEEQQAKQDAQLAKLRVEEMEQGVTDESSIAAKAQLEVIQSRHTAAISDLKSIKDELQQLKTDYAHLLTERDSAVENANQALSSSREVEKTVEDLTIQLITTKESLESAHATLLEAEEQRIGTSMARDQDTLDWETKLNQADLQLHKLNHQILSLTDLKTKLQSATDYLSTLQAELSAYMESKLENTNKDHLQEVKLNIERSTTEVNILKVAVSSLKMELQRENSTLTAIKQREGMASVTVTSLEAELNRIRSEITSIQTKEKEAREKMVQLPKMLQESALESDQAKLLSVEAKEKFRKAKEEAEQTKAAVNTIQTKLIATQKEIEASKASEKLALAAINALKESEESAKKTKQTNGNGVVTVSLEEYYELSKRAHEVEQEANARLTTAIAQVEKARESELQTLRKMEEVNTQVNAQRESLKIALENAEKAKERKLGVEQELRKWRSDHEERRRKEVNSSIHVAQSHPTKRTTSHVKEQETTDEIKVKKKKRSFFPRIFMFLSRKKTSSKTS